MKGFTFIIGAVLLAGCGGAPENRAQPAAEPRPVSVRVVRAEASNWETTREITGTVRARTSAEIASRLTAYVRQVRVQVGEAVRAGQTLVVLDSRDLEAALRQALQAQQEATAARAEAENAIAAASAQLELARVTHSRMQELFAKKSISNQEYDEAAAKLRLAEANHQMALARRRQVEAKIAQAAEAVKNAEIARGWAEITAPFAGVITEKRVEEGKLAVPGAVLFVLEQSGSYRLEVPVEESLLPRLRRGQSVEVMLDALDQTLRAPIGEIVPQLDPGSRAGLVKIDLPPLPQLKTGMSGRARFRAGVEQVLAIPEGALRRQGALELIFVAEQGQARSRLITVGESRDGRVRVLSGLSAGEAVVYPLPATLADGARVEVQP